MSVRTNLAPQVLNRLTWLCVVAISLVARPADAQNAAEASTSASAGQERREPVFSLRKQPSVRIGQSRLDVRAISEVRWREFPDDGQESVHDAFELRRVRLGIDGRVTRYVEYQVERELHGDNHPWRDVYVATRVAAGLRLQAGRFKMPFSLDQTTGVADGSFVHRSLAANALAPSRDVGIMAFGGVLRNVVRYEGGLFRRGGDNARVVDEYGAASQRTVAGRVLIRPWTGARGSLRPLRSLTMGAAHTVGRLPEGPNSLRAETVAGEDLANRLYVNGLRRRFGMEAQWRPGPASIQGEFMRASDERHAQGIDNEDLPNVVQRGWYVSATWLLTGEEKKDTVKPASALFRGGVGAFELTGRGEALRFRGASADGAGTSPRAVSLPEGRHAAWTVGLNWYPIELVKIQLNGIHETRAFVHGRTWSPALRIVFQL